MKKIIIGLSICILSASVNAAESKNGVYITGVLGSSIITARNPHSTYWDDGNVIYDSMFSSKSKGVFGAGVSVGYDFYDQFQLPVRVEIESTFRGKNKSNGNTGQISYINDNNQKDTTSEDVRNELSMETYMLNGYYDFHNSSDFIPYVSAGIGLAHLTLNNTTISDSNDSDNASGSANNFAWGLGAGIRYMAAENIVLEASYKYIDGGKVEASRYDSGSSYTSKVKTSSNDVMVGISYQF